ncbi:peroxiredoxin [Aquipuribacter nitratireducens]|uniref:Peroxiredoxin n=1 Tax=Aquipuribacter nitratireducens TaxID=650104 RepID=A0ABW0GN90_9MICO
MTLERERSTDRPDIGLPLEGTVPLVGEPAPAFALRDQHGQQVGLPELLAGDARATLLVFYPFAFSGTCTGELCELRDDLAAFAADGVQVAGLSCDPTHALRAWADAEGYRFPLLSDFWPHGEVARRYGVFLPTLGFATRGSFLVDRDGVVRWSVVLGPGQARDLGSYRSAVTAL